MKYELETRGCGYKNCTSKFKCMTTSKQIFCSKDCQVMAEENPKERARIRHEAVSARRKDKDN